MPAYTPSDTTAQVTDSSPPDVSEITDEANGGLPDVVRRKVTVDIEGSVTAIADASSGTHAEARAQIDVWDGSSWVNVVENEQIVDNPDSANVTVSGPWQLILEPANLSDLKVRARGSCSTATGAESSSFNANVTSWSVTTDARRAVIVA